LASASNLPLPNFPPFNTMKASLEMLKPVVAVSIAVNKIDLWVPKCVKFQHSPQLGEPRLILNAPPIYGKPGRFLKCG